MLISAVIGVGRSRARPGESASPIARVPRLDELRGATISARAPYKAVPIGKMRSALRLRQRPNAGSRAGLRVLTDRELLALAGEGKADAFEVIYERHSAVAYSLAYRVCGTQAVAEDVVQEAFLALWRGRDRYQPARGEVRGWLLGIVHNSAIDRLRRIGVHERRRASSEGIELRSLATIVSAFVVGRSCWLGMRDSHRLMG